MYYPCSKNKSADQLRNYYEADLHLWFRIGENPVFSLCGSFNPGQVIIVHDGFLMTRHFVVFPGSFEIPQVPAYYKLLSLRLFSLLDDIGASEEMRKVRMESAVTHEILHTVHWQPKVSVYNFGSQADGTTTKGMESDADVVRILRNLPVGTDPQDHPVGTSLLLIQDVTTPAGYCKLQLVQDGVRQYGNSPVVDPYPDEVCRYWLDFTSDTNSYADNQTLCLFQVPEKEARHFDQRHGPAMTSHKTLNNVAIDKVYAVECKSTREFLTNWIGRKRNWPTEDIIQTCKTLGCLFVPVGHPNSADQTQQWRLSFSHQEKMLVTHLNATQYKCFLVFKMIKKDIISKYVAESLSSYHIKTCILYALENTPYGLWKPENLVSCISLCLRKLFEWVQAGYCPNYFIPEENMFDRRVHGIVRKRLRNVLHQLISADCKFLTSIQCDGLGQRLLQYYLVPGVTTGDEDHCDNIATLSKLIKLRNLCENTFDFGILHLTGIFDRSLDSSLNKILKSISALLNTSTITSHTVEETQRAKSLMLPYLELSLLSNVVASAVDQNQNNTDIRRLLTSIRWKEISLSSDSFSSRLKQASMLYMLGDYQTSLNVLSSLTGLVRYSVCKCYEDKDIVVLPDDATLLETTRGIPDVTTQYLIRNVVIPCVYFLPTERSVTPAALCYEMERMRGPRPNSDDDLCRHNRHRGDWACVDGNFLLHFLLYLNHKKLNMTDHVTADIHIMYALLSKYNTSHWETCINLLGWVFKDQGATETANCCFRKSLQLKPLCNAASQHRIVGILCDLVCLLPWKEHATDESNPNRISSRTVTTCFVEKEEQDQFTENGSLPSIFYTIGLTGKRVQPCPQEKIRYRFQN